MHGKRALICVFTLAMFVAACESTGNRDMQAAADVRCYVFEAPAAMIADAIPTDKRADVADSPYSMAVLSQLELNQMMDKTGVLDSHVARVAMWPMQADSWSYSGAGVDNMYAGGGAGTFGVRRVGESREVRVEANVTHMRDGESLSAGKVTYEGISPDGSALVFLAPNAADEDSARYFHLVAFDVVNWQ